MKEKMKNLFTQNIGTKLLSVVIAGLVWIIIMSLSDPQVTKTIENIPVERRNEEAVTEEGKVYEALSGNRVSIRVRGSRSVVETMDVKDFVAYVDFKEIGWVNAVPIHVEFKNKNNESLAEITHKSKDVMSISLVENLATMVQVDIKPINVPEGYYAFCSSISSKLLEISGSKTQVESVEKLVGTVDLSGYKQNFQKMVDLVPVDIEGNEIDDTKLNIAQKYVRVDITVIPVKDVPVVLDTTGVTTATGFGISGMDYSPKTIQVAAEQDVLDRLTEIVIPYSADELMQSEVVEIEIAKYLPSGVYLKSETTSVVLSIEVERLTRKDISISTSDIEIRNLAEGLELRFDKNSFILSVRGISNVLDNLTVENMGLYLDMASVTSDGKQEVILHADPECKVDFVQKLTVYITDSAAIKGVEN